MEVSPSPSYNEDDFSSFIPFANGNNNGFTREVRLNIQVPRYHGYRGSKPFYEHEAQMDTGSTGLAISAIDLGYTDEAQLQEYEKGKEYLSSSRVYYEGYWVPTTVTFPDGNVSASVKILAVTLSGICSKFNNSTGVCEELSDQNPAGRSGRLPHGICYMGVGFGRLSTQQPGGTADRNPLLNIAVKNDGTTNSSGNIHQGYVITETGVWVGLTRSNSQDFRFTKLSPRPETQPTGLLREWNGTSAFIDYHDNLNMPGTALFDTGISQSYLSGIAFHDTHRLAAGDQYTIKIGNQADSPVETLDITVDDFANPITPSYVRASRRESAFVNTGRFFYRSFDVLLDAEEGWLGLRRH